MSWCVCVCLSLSLCVKISGSRLLFFLFVYPFFCTALQSELSHTYEYYMLQTPSNTSTPVVQDLTNTNISIQRPLSPEHSPKTRIYQLKTEKTREILDHSPKLNLRLRFSKHTSGTSSFTTVKKLPLFSDEEDWSDDDEKEEHPKTTVITKK